MAVAFRSYAKAAGTQNPKTVAKPANLAVGDLMVFCCTSGGGFPSTPPADFTQLCISGNDTLRLTVWTKTAVQADVDATTFQVGNSAALHLENILYAVSGAGPVEYSAVAYDATSRTAHVVSAGFTPAATGDLLLLFTQNTGATTTTWSTANNNPATWTTDCHDWAWYTVDSGHATYATGATGNITVTSSANTTASVAVVAVAAAPTGCPKMTDHYSRLRRG